MHSPIIVNMCLLTICKWSACQIVIRLYVNTRLYKSIVKSYIRIIYVYLYKKETTVYGSISVFRWKLTKTDSRICPKWWHGDTWTSPAVSAHTSNQQWSSQQLRFVWPCNWWSATVQASEMHLQHATHRSFTFSLCHWLASRTFSCEPLIMDTFSTGSCLFYNAENENTGLTLDRLSFSPYFFW